MRRVDGTIGRPHSCSPEHSDDGVDGQIVLSPGDVLLPLNIYVREPVTYTIEKGFIQDIRGGLEADLIKSYMKTFNDPRGMGMSHVGWGLDHRANWHGLCDFGGGMGMELRSFYGNVMFSTGSKQRAGRTERYRLPSRYSDA